MKRTHPIAPICLAAALAMTLWSSQLSAQGPTHPTDPTAVLVDTLHVWVEVSGPVWSLELVETTVWAVSGGYESVVEDFADPLCNSIPCRTVVEASVIGFHELQGYSQIGRIYWRSEWSSQN